MTPVLRGRTVVGGAAVALCLVLATTVSAQNVKRLVVVKADGLSQDFVDRFVSERDPKTGKSLLPWIEHVFYKGGARVSNFYVRGTSLSGPSWSLLDTGQPLQIKGNVEFDRYTQHPYDYLNFIPFWLDSAARKRSDMWGTAVIDELRMPLLLDTYAHDARLQSFQLFQRGGRWESLREGLEKRVTTRSKKQLFDEWQVGFDTRAIIHEQLERELIANLDNPKIEYLDYYTTNFDHDTHHNRDRATHLAALQELDAIIGRLWTAIGKSALGDHTAFVLIADHGVNSDERAFSQGYNLVHLLGSKAGGAHHVITKRRLMQDYSIKGIYPLVPLITTESPDASYLKGLQDKYQTALLDFDGNERASVHLRDSTLNTLQILLGQLQRRDLSPDLRVALINATLAIIDEQRPTWTQVSRELREEVEALKVTTDALRARVIPPDDGRRNSGNRRREKKKNAVVETPEQIDQRLREVAQVEAWTREHLEYTRYLTALDRLLALTREALARPLKVEEYVPAGAMGERNTLRELQHYVTSLSPDGLVLAADGTLDMERSFTSLDYLALLNGVRVRNNVQELVGNRPVDMVTLRVPCSSLAATGGLPMDRAELAADSCIWMAAGEDRQALLLSRNNPSGRVLLRYVPVARLNQDAAGVVHFERQPWRAGLPLYMWEDPAVDLPPGMSREEWFDGWHSDVEWVHVMHRARYSIGLVGLHEQMAQHPWAALDVNEPGLDRTEQLRRRYRLRQRALVEPDLLIMASDHWNFDVRGFNPGGNHGSFLRVSTHAAFMVAGGRATGLPQGLNVTEAYDSLSFMPTMLALTGRLEADNEPSDALRRRGFRKFPGVVITELLPTPAGGKPAGEQP